MGFAMKCMLGSIMVCGNRTGTREIGILLPNNQRQHRTLHIQKDVLPYALCSWCV